MRALSREHGPYESSAPTLHTPHFDPQQSHMLQVEAHRDIACVHRLPTKLTAQVTNDSLCLGIVPGNKHGRSQITIARVSAVFEIFVAKNGEGLYDLCFGYEFLHVLSSRDFILKSVCQSGADWIGAIYKDFI